jgi:site-specific recombinase XerD
MTPLRGRMIEDMRLAGLTARSQAIYVKAVRRLAAYYQRSPDELSEEEVRAYLVKLRDRGAARGTFKVALYAVQFLYEHTLGRDWPLFSKKRFVCPSTNGCRMRWPTSRSAVCLAA